MTNRLEFLSSDALEIVCDFLEGHDIHKLLACGSKRLSAGIKVSVRRFRLQLVQLETFPFYAFDFSSLSVLQVELESRSHDYPVRRGNRDLLPLQPMKALKILDLSFQASSSVLNDVERFCQVFPNLTDLRLKRGVSNITNATLESLPRTLKRLELFGAFNRPSKSSNEDINLTLLAKITQNLESLTLNQFNIVLAPNETLEQFEFSDSLLELWMDCVHEPELLTKLPPFIEHVSIGFYRSSPVSTIPTSALPATLRSLDIIVNSHKALFEIDGPFPPRLKTWNAQMNWVSMPPQFDFPQTLKEANFPLEVYGSHLERVPKSLTRLDTSDYRLQEAQVRNFPPSLQKLFLGDPEHDIMLMLPKTLRKLFLIGFKDTLLNPEVCERLEALEELTCSSYHFRSVTVLGAFKCLKYLAISAWRADAMLEEESLFSCLSSSTMDTLEHLRLIIGNIDCSRWPLWLEHLKECRNLKRLCVSLEKFCGNDSFPHYFKCLPPSLTQLQVPPIPLSKPFRSLAEEDAFISAPEFVDCFHHLPKSLTDLSFGYARQNPPTRVAIPLRLSDDCFTHLPPSLTQLNLSNVIGITERFWDIIPPNIFEIRFNGKTIDQHPSFLGVAKIYRLKFEGGV